MKRTSIVTGRPIYNHPEKDGFANEIFLSASGSSAAEIQAQLTKTETQLADLQDKLGKSNVRLGDWQALCNRQKCDQNAKNIISTETQNVLSYTGQIKHLRELSASLKKSLDTANKVEGDPVLRDIKAKQDKDENATEVKKLQDAQSTEVKKKRTMWIGISITAIVVIGGVIYFIKRKK